MRSGWWGDRQGLWHARRQLPVLLLLLYARRRWQQPKHMLAAAKYSIRHILKGLLTLETPPWRWCCLLQQLLV